MGSQLSERMSSVKRFLLKGKFATAEQMDDMTHGELRDLLIKSALWKEPQSFEGGWEVADFRAFSGNHGKFPLRTPLKVLVGDLSMMALTDDQLVQVVLQSWKRNLMLLMAWWVRLADNSMLELLCDRTDYMEHELASGTWIAEINNGDPVHVVVRSNTTDLGCMTNVESDRTRPVMDWVFCVDALHPVVGRGSAQHSTAWIRRTGFTPYL